MKEASSTDILSLPGVLGLLSDGRFHSGEELGELLGVSRAAVWKQLQKLDLLGLQLESVKGKGYRIPGGLDLLSGSRLHSLLDPEIKQLIKQLDIRLSVDSTNAEALRQASQIGAGYLCLAEQQTAGRGRRGRSWVSPFGRNIYLSISWVFDEGILALEGLSLAVGLVVVEALEQLGFCGLGLKWPNDILAQNQKLGGVLLEINGDPAGQCQVVVGVGLNVSMPRGSTSDITQAWTDLRTLSPAHFDEPGLGRNQLAASLINQLLGLLRDYANCGFGVYREAWQRRNAHHDQLVELNLPNRSVVGKVLGVDEKGALRLATDEGEQVFFGGEISLRAVR